MIPGNLLMEGRIMVLGIAERRSILLEGWLARGIAQLLGYMLQSDISISLRFHSNHPF